MDNFTLGEALSDHENRLLFLEHSYHIHEPLELSPEAEPMTNKAVYDKLHRIEVLMNDLENRLNASIDSKKKTKYK